VTYSFSSLSPADFEDLTRDLLGREYACRFEGFGPGPDGGIDGRHAKTVGTFILQAKHYRMSGFPALASQMRRERGAINQMAAHRYILATSVSLTPANKKALAEIIGPSLKASHDLVGFEDLNGLLRKHPEIAKSHVKLWLSDTAVLERILHAASINFTSITRADIAAKLLVYAENPSFSSGRTILEDHRVLIVSGPPGVGKTTLAEMLAYAYIGEDWELVAIRSLNDGFTRLDDTRKQVFFFDDFLGRIALDERALSTQDSELARFIARVRRTPTARFILTTRAYIYEQAKLFSESLSDRRLNVTRYMLDVGVYTRRIRARILYNHLIAAAVPTDYIRALHETGTIKAIIDHKHYNPRIVEWMTDVAHLGDVTAGTYPVQFVSALNNPELIWDKAFRNHIPRRCRHLLFALYYAPEYGAEIEDVREIFDGVHPLLCAAFGLSSDVKDFEESVRTLEGSFIAIANGSISFINPSVRDYLAGYLDDKALFILMAAGASNASCAARMVDQFKKLPELTGEDWRAMLSRFLPLCRRLNTIPKWRAIPSKPGSLRHYDLGNSGRIEMLLSWWRASGLLIFLETAIGIAIKPNGGFSPWDDARTLSDILTDLRTASNMERDQITVLADAVETAIHNLLSSNLDPDDLDRIINAIDRNEAAIRQTFVSDIAAAIPRMIDNIADNLGHVDSASTLSDFVSLVEALAQRVDYDVSAVTLAKRAIEQRIEEVSEEAASEDELSVTGDTTGLSDTFGDQDLSNLFAPLVATED
jgi:DNA polymerase III delta prime subunit